MEEKGTYHNEAKRLIELFMGMPIKNVKTITQITFFRIAKENAVKCCDEIIRQWEYIDIYIANLRGDLNPNLKYWGYVKQAIEDFEI